MVKVYAPASSANMSVGFDVLGAAVTPVDGALLGDVVTVEAAETFSLNNLGRFADKLPSEPRENISEQCTINRCHRRPEHIKPDAHIGTGSRGINFNHVRLLTSMRGYVADRQRHRQL